MEEAIANLPHDLIAHQILTRLPIKLLLGLKCVSKQWYSTLSSDQFALTYAKLSPSFDPFSPIQSLFIQHENDYYLFFYDDDEIVTSYTSSKNLVKLGVNFDVSLDDKLVFVGSCNGLICLASSFGCYFILWNPITGKFQKYSGDELVIDYSCPFRVSWGFGYVSNADDYKVIRILELAATLEIRVLVFSLKSNKWTRIADELYQDTFSLRGTPYNRFPFAHNGTSRMYPFSFDSIRGVLANESLYWVVSKINDMGTKVVSFDLVSEEFDTIVDLNMVTSFAYSDKFLCVLGGCLSKCGVNMRDDVSIQMLKYPGMVESIRLFRDLCLSSCKNIVGFTRMGKIFILLEFSKLVLVDPSLEPKTYTRLVEFGGWRNCHVASYVPSLTLPNTMPSCQVQRRRVNLDVRRGKKREEEGRESYHLRVSFLNNS
uniref:Fgenesh protein 115 n=1 Tax=Beta vulgaris TaxID=161934 RepID=Q1ZY06_BETVU|nr:Fgenesh protein 115 [Beta vulgaris]